MKGFTDVSKINNEISKFSIDLPNFAKVIKPNFVSDFSEADKKLGNEEISRMLPKEGGEWDGERGNSTFKLYLNEIPKKQNLDNKTWKEILPKNVDGIKFNDGEPDFTPISESTVEINCFSESRDKNFRQADIQEAEKRGCSPQEVREWRKTNEYTWHEREDCKTMDLVPSIIHNNVPHSGGISELKKRNGDKDE